MLQNSLPESIPAPSGVDTTNRYRHDALLSRAPIGIPMHNLTNAAYAMDYLPTSSPVDSR
jgi:hypothetical protein